MAFLEDWKKATLEKSPQLKERIEQLAAKKAKQIELLLELRSTLDNVAEIMAFKMFAGYLVPGVNLLEPDPTIETE